MSKNTYLYTHLSFAEYIKRQCKEMKNKHGLRVSTSDMSNVLMKKVIIPNRINLTDTVKPIDLKTKWKKIKLRL